MLWSMIDELHSTSIDSPSYSASMIRGIRKQIERAAADLTFIRVIRGIAPGHVTGYVVAFGDEWLVLLVVGDAISYSGYEAVRLSDITELISPDPYESFIRAALRKRRLRRPKAPAMDLSNVASLLSSAATAFPLIAIHREVVDPNVCHIGRLQSLTRTMIHLLEVTPNATWEAEPTPYRLKEITRVDFGGPYEEALALVAPRHLSLPASPIVR